MQPRVQAAASGVLAEEEIARHLAPRHAVEGWQLRMIALDPRQPAETKVVLGPGGVSVPRLEQADYVLAEVTPEPVGLAFVRDVGISVSWAPSAAGCGR